MGPTLEISEQIHKEKYRGKNESFYEAMCRIAGVLCDSEYHRENIKGILLDQRFLPAGRIQSAIGSPRQTTAFNCFVSQTIPDSAKGIMETATKAYETMRRGGGIGYDFSTVRYRDAIINSLYSKASGAVSHMDIFDSVCGVVASAGNRRGAQMGVLRIDHPDIEEFIRAKQNANALTNFNISVAVTDEFMEALINGDAFDLKWEGQVVETIDPEPLWNEIMRATWDWAEPGLLFIDRINEMNNLHYCETIAATNPCGEQPLPPNGACLLGSFNLVKYLVKVPTSAPGGEYRYDFNWEQFKQDIPDVVRAMDNVIDNTIYPLDEQELEAKSKRRMGLGTTGTANAIEALGYPYGSDEFCDMYDTIMSVLTESAYRASVKLAEEKGPFQMFDRDKYTDSEFVKQLPRDVQESIFEYGIRNSHLISIAPCGTISLTADNVSSGIEPVFAYNTKRLIKTEEGEKEVDVPDYGIAKLGVKGRTASDITAGEHLRVLLTAVKWSDSAVSKTCNVGDNVTWNEFKSLNLDAWQGGAKGITTFRPAGKRFGILVANDETDEENTKGAACYIDSSTGVKTCDL